MIKTKKVVHKTGYKFYSAKYDIVFKEFFLSNPNLLKELLSETLKIKIDDIKIIPTELLSKNAKVRGKRVDALVYAGNKKIEIEVNSQTYKGLNVRNMSYLCNIYQGNTLKGEMYTDETDIIQLNFTWGLNKVRKKEERGIYQVVDIKTKEKYVKNFTICEINMDYYDDIWYHKDEKEIEKNKYLIMIGRKADELKKMKKDRIVKEFEEKLIKLNQDPEFQEYMSEEEDNRKVQNTLLYEAREEGMSRGISQGISQGIAQTAINMLKKNINVNDISEITGMSVAKIKKLKI